MDRAAKVFAEIPRGVRVLELGPSYSPFAPKSEGWDTCVVDHAAREELIDKYRSVEAVDVSRIEAVDVVWDHGALDDALPLTSHGSFDAVIASHFIEHIPDPIRLLQSLERILKPSGVVSLVVPDKRYCFDFFKPISTTGELLAAHDRRATRHSRRTLFDDAAYSITSEGVIGWGQRPATELAFFHSFADAKAHLGQPDPTDDDPYLDRHGWHFTPSSFELVVLELAALETIDLVIDRTFPTEGTEFYVTLRRGRRVPADDDELQALRLGLLRGTLEEVGEQVRLLTDGSVSPPTPAATDLEAVIEALRLERDEVLRKYETAMSSKSWRLMTPLRWVAALLRRLYRRLT